MDAHANDVDFLAWQAEVRRGVVREVFRGRHEPIDIATSLADQVEGLAAMRFGQFVQKDVLPAERAEHGDRQRFLQTSSDADEH